jgi:hypothetical protein
MRELAHSFEAHDRARERERVRKEPVEKHLFKQVKVVAKTGEAADQRAHTRLVDAHAAHAEQRTSGTLS